MKQILGIWLPDGDEHFKHQLPVGPIIGGKATYQYKKYLTALKYVAKRGHAVDVGGHVGLWSRVMAKDFETVTAFEPMAELRACFLLNVEMPNVNLLPYAIGNLSGPISMYMPDDNTGHAHVRDAGKECEMVTIDSLGMEKIDLLKIDVEGFEFEVITGAETTIRCDGPVVVVEQKAENAERYGRGRWDAVNLLKSWGMTEAKVMAGDHIMVW